MSWFTDSLCAAEAIKEHACITYAVDLDFPSGHVRLGTWRGNLTVNGNTYIGAGSMVDIPDTPERARLTAERWTYQLSGVDLTIVPESELDNCLGRSVTEYEVWINSETHAVIGYEIRREGAMSGARRRHGGKQPIIAVDVETRLVVIEQADGWCYTTEHQEDFFSGDLGCDQARENDSREIIWNGTRVEVGHSVAGIIARRVLGRRG